MSKAATLQFPLSSTRGASPRGRSASSTPKSPASRLSSTLTTPKAGGTSRAGKKSPKCFAPLVEDEEVQELKELSEEESAREQMFLVIHLENYLMNKEDREPRRGQSAAQSLLRCIHKVVCAGRVQNTRGSLQDFVLAYVQFEAVAKSGLPSGMETPRSAFHIQDRLRHFDSMKRDTQVALYAHPLELPLELRSGPCAEAAAAALDCAARGRADPQPPKLKARSMLPRSAAMSRDTVWSVNQIHTGNQWVHEVQIEEPEDESFSLAYMQKGRLSLLYDSTHRAAVGRRSTVVSSGFSEDMMRRTSTVMTRKSSAMTRSPSAFSKMPSVMSRSSSELDVKAAFSVGRELRRGSRIDEDSIPSRCSTAGTLRCSTAGDMRACVSGLGGGRRLHSAGGRLVPAPRLTGATSGFSGVTQSAIFKPIEEVHCTECVPVPASAVEDEEPEAGEGEEPGDASSATGAAEALPPDGADDGSEARAAPELASEARRPPTSEGPEASASQRRSSHGSAEGASPSAQDGMLPPIVASKPRQSYADGVPGVSNHALKRSVAAYTKRALQQRGWEGSAPRRDLGSRPRAADLTPLPLPGGRFAGTSRSSSQPSLGKDRALPLNPLDVLGISPDRKPSTVWPWSNEVRYSRGCAKNGVTPKLVKHLACPSHILDLEGQLLGDADLDAVLLAAQAPRMSVAGQFEERPQVTQINLKGNPGLTDLGMERFLRLATTGVGAPRSLACVPNLKSLCLAGCAGLGKRALSLLAELLQSELASLESLDISGVDVPAMMWEPLTQGITESAGQLKTLKLAETGCGRQEQASCELVAGLIEGLGCAQLETLDLSGNHFLLEGCRAVGVSLKRSGAKLRELDFSHNAGGLGVLAEICTEALTEQEKRSSKSNPIVFILEALGETTLEKVALSNCQLSGMEDSVLEDSLSSSDITTIDVTDNPHGEEGLRSLIRVMVRDGQGGQLAHVKMGACRHHPMSTDAVIYDYVNPAMAYRLYLENAQHRSVLRLLLKRSEEVMGNDSCSCFDAVVLDGKAVGLDGFKQVVSKRRDRGDDDWQVPEEGLLQFQFNLPTFMDSKDDVAKVFQKFSKTQKLKVGLKGLARIVELYKSLKDVRSKTLMIESMRRDLSFNFCQVKHLAAMDGELRLNILRRLLPETTEPSLRNILYDLVVWSTKGWSQELVENIRKEFKSLVFLNPEHTDGHYELNLEVNADRGCAQRCLVLARWAKVCRESMGLPDISEYGNYECLWHTRLSEKKFKLSSDNFQLPGSGVLSFDFVAPRLMLGKQEPTTDEELAGIEQVVKTSTCNVGDKLNALRLVAHLIVLRPMQLRQALEWFDRWPPKSEKTGQGGKTLKPRAELYILLYNRTTCHADVVSPFLLYNPDILHRDEVLEIRARLGWMHTFDLLGAHDPNTNLGNRHGPIDLGTFDGWTIVMLLVAIDQQEDSPNFDNGWWSEQAAFYERGFTFILPAAWVSEGPPHVGEFYTTFVSKEAEIKWEKRKDLARRYLNWTFDLINPARNRQNFRFGGVAGLAATR